MNAALNLWVPYPIEFVITIIIAFWHCVFFYDEQGVGLCIPNLENQEIFGQGFHPLAFAKPMTN